MTDPRQQAATARAAYCIAAKQVGSVEYELLDSLRRDVGLGHPAYPFVRRQLDLNFGAIDDLRVADGVLALDREEADLGQTTVTDNVVALGFLLTAAEQHIARHLPRFQPLRGVLKELARSVVFNQATTEMEHDDDSHHPHHQRTQ